ncbi:MAG: DUF456 family protein [Verrucomicrobiales bacterium]|nr:DUF456 family protein [Verrucomicrobiales bacterium]
MIFAAVKDWFDWFPAEAAGDTAKWILVITLIVVGFVGSFLPIVPGAFLLWLGAVLHYFLFGMQDSGLSWQGLVVISLLLIVSLVIDWLSGALGAKWFGSSKWGMLGAFVGAIVGLFFSLPGLILGPIIGVFVFEMYVAKKEMKDASNSTIGTVVGGLAGLIARAIVSVIMLVWYLADVFVFQ